MATDVQSCIKCNVQLKFLGQIPLRSGGSDGAAVLMFGGLAESSEKVLNFDLYRCPTCAKLEFYDHDFSLPRK